MKQHIFPFVMGMALSAIVFTSFPRTDQCPEHHLTSNIEKTGCIADWVSNGLVCRWIDAQGNVITTRSY